MPMNGKFCQSLLVKKIVKIGQYLAKICTKFHSLLFWPTLYMSVIMCVQVGNHGS